MIVFRAIIPVVSLAAFSRAVVVSVPAPAPTAPPAPRAWFDICATNWPSNSALSSEFCSYASSSPTYFTTGYTVSTQPCAPSVTARSASGLNSLEAAYIASHTSAANAALSTYLSHALPDKKYVEKLMVDPPRIGFGLSGGGFRAMLTNAGVMKAFKYEDGPIIAEDRFKGLLDASSYLSALSGGAWTVGSWALGGYQSIDATVSHTMVPGCMVTWLIICPCR